MMKTLLYLTAKRLFLLLPFFFLLSSNASAQALAATATKTDITCFGANNGTADVSVTGGTAPYEINWDHGLGSSPNISGLTAGTYTATITDFDFNITTASVTIIEPAVLGATNSFTAVSCHGGSNGTATVIVSGGTGPYTYSWSGAGGTLATASGLTAGSYTCTITDAHGCGTTSTVNVTEPASLTATTNQTNITCNGSNNGVASVTVFGGTAPYSYSWSPSGGTAATATGLAATTYLCTISDNNMCQTTRSFNILEPAVLSVTPTQQNVLCRNGATGTATVSVSGGTAPYGYSWAPSGGTGATASGLTAGTYTCTITDNNGCQATHSFTITQPTKLVAAKIISPITCNGSSDGSLQLNVTGGTGGYTYAWTPNVSTTNVAGSLNAGTYSCVVSDANGCTITPSQLFTEPSAMVVTTTQTNVSCFGNSDGSAGVSVTGGAGFYSYSWSPSGGTGATVTGLTAGTYTCTITDDNFCTSTATFAISEPGAAAVTITSDPANRTIFAGQNTTFTVAATGATAYQWQIDAGSGFIDLADGGNYSGATTATLSVTAAAIGMDGYAFRCVATAGSCATPQTSAAGTLTVNAQQGQTITFGPMSAVDYGADPFSPGATASSGLTVNYASSDNSIASIVSGEVVIHKAGTVTITATQPGNAGYTAAAPVSQTLVIQPKSITAQISSSPEIAKDYDGTTAATIALQNYSLPGLVGSDVVSVSGVATYDDKNVGQGKDVLVINLVLSGADKNNYVLSSTTGNTVGEIRPQDITVNFNLSPPITKQYDGTNSATISSANYSVNGVIGSEDVRVTVMATFNDKHAGNPKVVTGVNLLGGADAGNYQLANVTETIQGSISPRPAQATADDATKVYGEIDPAFTYSVTGLLGTDQLSGSPDRETGKDVGQYAINVGSLSGNGDYDVSFTPARFTITPAHLLISANDQARQQGTTNPALTLQYTGFVTGEDAGDLTTAPGVSTTAIKNSPMGYYDITVAGAASNNYDISYRKGTLTILPAEGQMLKGWKSGSTNIEVRVYSDRVQSAVVSVHGALGQMLASRSVKLTKGINSTTLPAGGFASGAYTINVGAESFKQAIQVWVP